MAAVGCAAVHLLASGLLLQTGAPPLWLAQAGTLLTVGCTVLVLLHRVFLYPPLPLLLMASIGLALQRAPRPETYRVLEARPVTLEARLKEWHQDEEEAWAVFDRLQELEGRQVAPRPLARPAETLLGLTSATRAPPPAGATLLLQGSLTHDGRAFRLEAFRWTVKHADRAPPLSLLRQAVQARLQSSLSPEQAGLAVALLLGERRDLAAWQADNYRRFGLVHLLAVSGMHFWLWDRLLRRCLRGPTAYLRLPLLGFAAALAGGSAPVMRALCVIILRDVMARHAKVVPGLHLWAAAWLLEVALWRPEAHGLGFLLSYAATAFLILGAAPIARPWWIRTLQASWVAFLGSMPFLHQVQGTVEPWSIPLSPLLGVLLPLRLCGALIALLPGCALPTDYFLQAISHLEATAFRWLEHAPGSPWSTTQDASLWYYLAAAAGLAAVLPKWKGRPWIRIFCWSLFAIGIWAPTHHRPGISVLQVGHGLAVVVAGETRSLSFDLGSGERSPRDLVDRILYPELLQRHWPVPDRAVESHADWDHVNGYPMLRARHPFSRIELAPGESLALKDLEPWQVTVHGCGGARKGVRNDAGHVLDLHDRTRDVRIVLLGDQAGFALEDLVERLPAGPIDILLVPHHGLTTEGLAPLLEHLQPRQAWSSSGPRNFPLPVAPLLQHFDIPIHTTMHGPLRH